MISHHSPANAPVSLQVLYSKFGFMYQDLKLGEDEYILIREDDVIGIMPRSNAQSEDIPEMQPMGDRWGGLDWARDWDWDWTGAGTGRAGRD